MEDTYLLQLWKFCNHHNATYLKFLSTSVGPIFSISCTGFLGHLLAQTLHPAFSEFTEGDGLGRYHTFKKLGNLCCFIRWRWLPPRLWKHPNGVGDNLWNLYPPGKQRSPMVLQLQYHGYGWGFQKLYIRSLLEIDSWCSGCVANEFYIQNTGVLVRKRASKLHLF